jgi:hypothetical protein
MNWFLKFLGYRDKEYRGVGYSVRIEQIMREEIAIIYTRRGNSLSLNGERIGKKWEAIHVLVPQEVEAAQLPCMLSDLKAAFVAMRYGYVIVRKSGHDIVPEAERQSALAELRDMGWDIELLPDRTIRQTRRADVPLQDLETTRKTTPRMMTLLQSVEGRRQRCEVLAKSSEF